MRALPLLRGTLSAVCLGAVATSAAVKPRSLSTSRHFIVYGTEVPLRGAICDLAERTKSDLLQLLGTRDNWKTPLIINLDYPRANYPDAPEARLDVSQLGFGLKLQLNLLIGPALNGPAVQRELLRAILVEMMYRERGQIAAGSPYVTPPDWLVEGVLSLQPGRASDQTAALLRSVVATNKIPPLEEIVRQRRAQLDGTSRQLFQAYARALLQLLLETPDGQRKLVRFIVELPDAPNDLMADLARHFPGTLGRAPDRWWSLSVARLSASDRFETLSLVETGARLDRILHFSFMGKDGKPVEYSLGDYAKFRRSPSRLAILQQVAQRLQLLRAQAHPSYQPIVQEEYELAELLARGKTGHVTERLARVASYRKVIERQSTEIEDYLNWYEATQSNTLSGAFSHLLQPPSSPEASLARRRDAISVYLDSLEMETN